MSLGGCPSNGLPVAFVYHRQQAVSEVATLRLFISLMRKLFSFSSQPWQRAERERRSILTLIHTYKHTLAFTHTHTYTPSLPLSLSLSVRMCLCVYVFMCLCVSPCDDSMSKCWEQFLCLSSRYFFIFSWAPFGPLREKRSRHTCRNISFLTRASENESRWCTLSLPSPWIDTGTFVKGNEFPRAYQRYILGMNMDEHARRHALWRDNIG